MNEAPAGDGEPMTIGHWREADRLAALARYEILDTAPELAFDDIVKLASEAFAAPIAVVNLVAGDRQWFKAEHGLGVRETPLDVSICAKILLQPGLTVVPDLTQDARFDCNPLVVGAPGLRFYAGALLETPEGLPLGTLCVLDTESRPGGATARQAQTLSALARQVMGQLELRRAVAESRRSEAALRASEARLAALFAQASVGLAEVSLDGRFLRANGALCAILGRSHADVLSASIAAVTEPEDLAKSLAALEQVVTTGQAVAIEKRFRQPGGRIVFVSSTLTRLIDEDGRPQGVIAAVHDLTGQRATEARAVLSEASLRLATEAAEIGTWDLDLTTDVLTWTDRTKAMFGISPDAPCSMADFYAGLHPEDREATSAAFASAIDPAERAAYDVEYRTIGKEDGIVRWVAAKGRALFDPDGRCLRAIGTAIDIGARKLAEERLRASEAQLRELNETLEQRVAERTLERDRTWNNSQELLLVVSGDGIYRAANPAWQRILGWSQEEVIGRHYLDFVHPDDHAVTAAARSQLASRPLAKLENRHRCKDGSYRWFSWVATPEGGMSYASGRDVTAEKERQARLDAAEEQLRQAQKMEAVGQLTGGIAHDFNNLLTGIIGSLDLLNRRIAIGRTENLTRYTSTALASATRAASLTQRLLAFSRRQSLDPKVVVLNSLVLPMEELIRRSVGERITLETVLAGGLWPTRCDTNQLENALLNLCINARDAMPEGGRLTIETANAYLDEAYARRERDVVPGQYVMLCVTDTGSGMAPDVRGRAFEPFFTTKPIGQGTGLGLSQLYGFIKQSSGHVALYSEPGHGTTVRVYLPRWTGEVEAEATTDTTRDPPRAEAHETLLVVEDEDTVRMLILDVLEDLGYASLEAIDSASALTILESPARIDLLITDVGLPGLNGRQLADRARQLRPDLKVLFITGYAHNAAIGNGLLAPGMEVMSKPFAIDLFANKVRGMIEAE